MRTPASIKGHPIHPMLIAFPIGLWGFSLVADIVHYWKLGGFTWNLVAYYTMAGGVIGALVAAVPGLIDLMSIDDRKARRIGIAHMVINLTVVALYLVNLFIRGDENYNATLALGLSVTGVGLLAASGWLGGELVYVFGVSVNGRPHVEQRS